MKIPFIVRWKNINLILFSICSISLVLAVSGCGDDYSSSDDDYALSNTGSYACSIKWSEDVPTLETASTVSRGIDCDAAGVATVAFTFYDGSGSYLTGDEWSCSLHQGTVHGIPAGTNRRLVVTGEDASGTVLYRGKETGIEIVPGQTTQGGVIEMERVQPTATITSPSDGSIYTEGDTITFSGSGEDPEDGTLTGSSLVWTSSIDGEIGTGTSFTKDDLSVGSHTITLTATDSDAATGTDSVGITVNEAGSPTATITSPSDGSIYTEGDTITFSGSGEDPEDGTLTGSSLVWTSSIDGEIGTGESFERNDLPPETHRITLTARDSDEATGNDEITIIINRKFTRQIQKLLASGAQDDQRFGDSVGISGDYTIVGATWDDEEGTNAGAAYIFHRDPGTDNWDSVKKITAPDTEAYDFFGGSVEISGDYAIVGARLKDEGAENNVGAAYIFRRTGTNTWDSGTKIMAPDAEAYDDFGVSVGISGDYAIVGAFGEDTNGNDAGAAYIFRRTGTNTWGDVTKIPPPDDEAEEFFGHAVDISGDYAIVGSGSPYNDPTGTGGAYIFHRNDTNNWYMWAKIKPSDPEVGDHFGYSVAIGGNYAVVGAVDEDEGGQAAGAAYIFRRVSENMWDGGTKIRASDLEDEKWFGFSVGISSDYAIIGAHGDDAEGVDAGAAYIFKRTGTNTWENGTKITASDAQDDDLFGFSVGISSDYAIIGALRDDEVGVDAGAAYIFK